MNPEYEKIIHLPHPSLAEFHRMSADKRAMQFAPFAALTGYDDAIVETARLTAPRIEQDEAEKEIINEKLRQIFDHPEIHPVITVTYFRPDPFKEGGSYRTTVGTVVKADPYAGTFLLDTKETINISDIYGLDIHD